MRLTVAIAFVLGAPGWALAHEGHQAPVIPGPSAWDVATMIGLLIAGGLYLWGGRRMRRGGGRMRTVERASFWAGWAALVLAVAPWMDRAAALRLSSHMVQHELLMLVGAPLVMAGRPIVPWLWALPTGLRRRAGAGLGSPVVHPVWTWLTTPVVAWALHGTAVWVWHLPVLYEAAVESEGIHALQHATFVGTAVLFWWGLVYGRYGRAAYGASALFVFTTMVHTGVLGAFFALSSRPFYAVYQERAPLAGVDATTDQQLAGLYMWIPAGLILTALGLALLVAWLAESERRGEADKHGGRRIGRAAGAAAILAVLLPAGEGEATPRATPATLRVCADPNNLPFSNRRGEGFENRIADLVARDAGADLAYTWWAQRRGFFRNTLGSGACDVVMGVPRDFERVLATRPYYRSTYVFVTRADRPAVRSFDDGALRSLKVGVQLIGDDYANAPAAHALARRGIVRNVVGFDLYGDYTQDSPPSRIVAAVAQGAVDVAVVWGPLAGYYAPRQPVALRLTPVSPPIDPPGLPFVFDISMGVRRGDTTTRDRLEEVLRRRRADIDGILREYGVPRVDAPGK